MATSSVDRIFEIEGIEELSGFLAGHPEKDVLRERLYDEFLRYSRYRDAAEWNAAVRICEALAILGWGKHEPVEAILGKWFNGNPETFFINRDSRPRFLDAVWSRRKDGLAIDPALSRFYGSAEKRPDGAEMACVMAGEAHDMPLRGQRNWIPKCPIRIVRGLANCYEGSRALIESIEQELVPALRQSMRPELYGPAIDEIVLNLSFSFYDNHHCKTNYIIADEALKLKHKDFYPKLLEMYTEKEIADNGYFLRNRFTHSPFRKEKGCARVGIVLEKEFSMLPVRQQKQVLVGYLAEAVGQVAKRLERKIGYDFRQMISDFNAILQEWMEKQPAPISR